MIFCAVTTQLSAQDIFPPPATKRAMQARRTTSKPIIDGLLNESAWQQTPTTRGFTIVEPRQGDSTQFDTDVKILFDDDYLYIGAFCRDTVGWAGVRVPDLRRDFDYFTNDFFGVHFDTFLDERNAQAFQVNPYGAQRDLLGFDDTFFDRDWDGVWRARTNVTDSGWTAEIAIPWSTLRYPRVEQPANNLQPRATTANLWGINFMRVIRRHNIFTGWSLWPRAYSANRMPYAGRVEGIEPPPPSVNLRVQPYIVTRYVDSHVQGERDQKGWEFHPGGEVKWAVTPNTILDVTVNTDFAQADADRQVVNLSRFSVFFPERRQFFLESASLFNTDNRMFSPFFSRRIGLDVNNNPLALDAGLRLVHRTADRAAGGLVIRQRGNDTTASSTFLVARYAQNVGDGHRIGAMVTTRFDDASPLATSALNVVGVLDAFYRVGQDAWLRGVVSGSFDKRSTDSSASGLAAYFTANYQSNTTYLSLEEVYVSKTYYPATGFVARNDLIRTNPEFELDLRPSWKPDGIRSLKPSMFFEMYHSTVDLAFQEAHWRINPCSLLFESGSSIEAFAEFNWQNIKPIDEFDLLPELTIHRGAYHYATFTVRGSTDQSEPLSGAVRAGAGGYYDGSIRTVTVSGRAAPIPQVAFTLNYEWDNFRNVSAVPERTSHLASAELRLALNPRLQFVGFYQYNTAAERTSLNMRFSWEFEPLSFVYLVFNDGRTFPTEGSGLLPRLQYATQYKQTEAIFKISYLRQL